jgi:hypothetical protein
MCPFLGLNLAIRAPFRQPFLKATEASQAQPNRTARAVPNGDACQLEPVAGRELIEFRGSCVGD